MAVTPAMQTLSARLATFQQVHQLSKRRASSTSKKKGTTTITAEWPHEQPAVEELALVGFYYRPAPDNLDNVQCFLCAVRLDGWEASDSPLAEHLSHAPKCAWATCLSVSRSKRSTSNTDVEEEAEPEEPLDPMCDVLVAARTKTFQVGKGWPHEGEPGWRCQISEMVDAGWAFDPGAEMEDGVTCFYCGMSLDGWEPGDDPYEEHRRRKAECPFFVLCEKFGHGRGHGGGGKQKGGKGRLTASKGSRVSTQSAVSVVVSEAESEMAVNDSIMSNATTASQATVKGGKKKGGRTAKGGKGRKRANTVEEPEPERVAPEPQYRDAIPSRQSQAPGAFPESSVLEPEVEDVILPPPPPTRATRKGTRQSKQPDTSVFDASQLDGAAPVTKKSTRGRKAKASQPEPEPEPELELENEPEAMMDAEPEYEPKFEYDQRMSDVSAQLQEELEHSISHHDAPDDESTPQAAPRPKRGVKRSSDGMVKREQESSVVMGMEFPEPPVHTAVQAKAKGKKGRKVSKQVAAAPRQEEERVQVLDEEQESGNWEVFPAEEEAEPEAEPEPEVKQPVVKKAASKSKKAPAAKRGKGKKASSTRSSKATATDREPVVEDDLAEGEDDLERDEREIEAELARMAEEQAARERVEAVAVMEEQERVHEFEASPLPELGVAWHGDGGEMQEVEEEVQAGTKYAPEAMAEETPNEDANTDHAPSPTNHQNRNTTAPTPSPNGSDKENHPSSLPRPTTALKAPTGPFLSPTKTTTRIPLAPGTPNTRRLSPTKSLLSPTKTSLHLSTTHPWTPVDLDLEYSLFSHLASPASQSTAMTPGTLLASRLMAASGGLTSPEKAMSVEEWVRWRAEQGEAELRRRGEGLVSLFEREGGRGLGSLAGVEVVGGGAGGEGVA
ncbi:hypothetical protein B0A55_09630 [Friedmanniomyces simplex]|uniref:BIR-domain-containing protein n=1 Tax=Friedmanniomyces simplex TaxID=329884 RepID=A0A4U0X730_9PEZI|nr:hypothetical protein B0A55_09630 [Friedmanniomyces simplex]